MEALSSNCQSENVVGIYKQDIDDNCPMTGDETDTETNTYFDHAVSGVISETEHVYNTTHEVDDNLLPRRKKLEAANGSMEIPLVSIEDDEEESFSSDRNYFSDEETSSIAGSFDDFGRDDEDSMSEPQFEKKTHEDKVRRLALRQHLDQLGKLVVEKECIVQDLRDELQKCRDYLIKLNLDLKNTSEQMNDAESKGKMAVFHHLKSKYEKLTTEIEIEQKVESQSLQNLEDAEFYLAQTYIEHAKFLPMDEELETEEQQLEKIKGEKASARIKKELNTAMLLERRKKNRDKEHISAIRERERKNRQALISTKKNREIAMKYLKDTMSRVRQHESEEEDKSRQDLNQRMNALLSLKRNIESNKENIKAVQARDNHLRNKEEVKEHQERQRLIAMGENPDEVMTRRKRIQQFERDKEAFERKQREREIEIVNKVMSEEKQMKRRYQQQPQLWPDNRPRRVPRKRSKPRFAPSSGSESMEYGADVEDTGGKISYLSKVSTDDEGEFSPYGATNRDDDRETTEDDDGSKDEDEIVYQGEKQDEEEDDESLAEPEFKGLWDHENNEVPGKNISWKTGNHEYSKYEQEMMKNALSKQKQNLVQKQIAAGREFKGAAFYSKPEVVIFKDFDVGKHYKKKVLLTNVSYTQNYCQFIGISDNLKDFIEIEFTPPGSMSAGLTCDLSVTFKPMINKDLEGQIEMMAKTGLFYIPIKALIKRCEVSVDTNEVDFENQVVGETRKKIITLKNDGALQTSFIFLRKKKENNLSVVESSESDRSMKIGKISEGVLAPFSSVQLDITYAPISPETKECNFIISFTDETIQPITIHCKGVGVDLPVWVEREVIDLRICMYDRLYQDAVTISNRATSALRFRFEIPKEFRNHLEVLPKTAYIQAESQFSAQLKFLPRETILKDAAAYLNKENGLLKIPVTIRVADQTQPVQFVVQTMVTSSDFEFNTKEINFGYCTVYETVHVTVQLLNKSVLPQQYGFVGTPEGVDVQPNDGFGTVLPNESLDIDIAFSPTKAQDYQFDIVCKSHIGREFLLHCKAVGILPPLHLSHSYVEFRATSINDVSSAHLFVINNHTSTNQFTHPVPRVGSESIFPVGPTSYHFVVPKDIPVSISPAIGTVLPGQKNFVHVTYSPKINSDAIKSKAVQVAQTDYANKVNQTCNEKIEQLDRPKSKFKNQKGVKTSKGNTPLPQSPAKSVNAQVKENVVTIQHHKKAEIQLQRSYEKSFNIYKIPCFLAYGECGDPGSLEYNPNYTLYLEIHCPAVRPAFIVVSENGDSLVDFGKVSMGRKHSQIVSIQNISDETLKLTSSILHPHGPFEMVNALRPVQPNAIFSMMLSFTPQDNNNFFEVLEISSKRCTMQVKLKGQGIKPELRLEPNVETLDVGDALIMDEVMAPLKLTNISELSMEFDISFGSWLNLKHSRTQTPPMFLKKLEGHADDSFLIGTANKSGLSVFGCKPCCHGNLEPGESKEFHISFSPDHPSELFRDELLVKINGAEEFLKIHVIGRGWPSIAFTRGWDRLTPAEESLAPVIMLCKEDQDGKPITQDVLMTFHSEIDNSKYEPVERTIEIGCIKSNLQTKKSCDFSFENTKEAYEQGFTIDPLKGGVDIGSKKHVTFKWIPPQNVKLEDGAKATVTLLIRGDTMTTYKVRLTGYAVSKEV